MAFLYQVLVRGGSHPDRVRGMSVGEREKGQEEEGWTRWEFVGRDRGYEKSSSFSVIWFLILYS